MTCILRYKGIVFNHLSICRLRCTGDWNFCNLVPNSISDHQY